MLLRVMLIKYVESAGKLLEFQEFYTRGSGYVCVFRLHFALLNVHILAEQIRFFRLHPKMLCDKYVWTVSPHKRMSHRVW